MYPPARRGASTLKRLFSTRSPLVVNYKLNYTQFTTCRINIDYQFGATGLASIEFAREKGIYREVVYFGANRCNESYDVLILLVKKDFKLESFY